MSRLPSRRSAATLATPVGRAVVVAGPAGVSWIGFDDPPDGVPVDPQALRPITDAVQRWFDDPSALDDVPLDAPVSRFAGEVRAALREVLAGSTTTYGQLARRLGRPGGSRAVGRALATNPVSLAVPCHRVVRSDGTPGGYAWGVDRKLALLTLEDRNTPPGDPT